MQFINPFQEFHPIKGSFNSNLPIILNFIAERARKIIKDRKTEEISYALSTINYLLLDDIDSDVISESIETAGQTLPALAEESLTLAAALMLRMEDLDISNQDLFPAAKQEEYFAILALAALGELNWIYHLIKEVSVATVGLAAEAMEALAVAESLATLEPIQSLDEAVREKISLQNKLAAIKRHSAYNDLKARFIRYYLDDYLPTVEGGNPNRSEAARRFVHEIFLSESAGDPESLIYDRGREQMIRTLLDALRDYLRSTDSN